MRRQPRTSPFIALLVALAFMVGGLYVCVHPRWFVWGAALMALGLALAARCLYLHLMQGLETATQINLLHESRILSGDYGAARLAVLKDRFVQALINARRGLFIGTLEGQKLFYDPYQRGNGHMLAYAPARTGKTTSLVVPALLHWTSGSVIVTDVKGELTELTAAWRRKDGQRILILNPFGARGIPGLRFNPLRVLVEDVLRTGGRDLHALGKLIALQLIPERGFGEGGDGIFFRNGGRRLIVTFLLYLAAFEPRTCTLPGLRACVWSSEAEKFAIAAKMQGSKLFAGLLREYGNALADGLEPEYVKTFGAFRDNALNALDLYEAHSDFGKSLMESDFTLSDVLDGRTTLYLILPESKLETHGPWMGLIVTLLLETVAASATMHERHTRLLFLLEEMGNLGRLPNLGKALSLLPGKGVRCWMIFQSRRQSLDIYGPNIAGLIEEQSSLMQAWSIRSEFDRKAWSARIGNATRKGRSVARDAENLFSPWRLSVGERGFPVLSPDEIGRLPEHEQLIAIAGQPVIRAKKLPYFADAVWAKRAGREKNSSPAPRPAPARAG
ncbi:MAG: type IV secretory system conjugative DNA transfer family protein [Alphaproteobacteria bacterium]|nr:type IV secretory system conjugative DNA transfer family protein [Alphaproteobacteria bacterium]